LSCFLALRSCSLCVLPCPPLLRCAPNRGRIDELLYFSQRCALT
jgi:hypothetical protein